MAKSCRMGGAQGNRWFGSPDQPDLVAARLI
jgi:hypothetical protein